MKTVDILKSKNVLGRFVKIWRNEEVQIAEIESLKDKRITYEMRSGRDAGRRFTSSVFGPKVRIFNDLLEAFDYDVDEMAKASKISKANKKKYDGKFVVFVDGMDGDRYEGAVEAGGAVTHALLNGAKKVEVKRVKK